MKLPSHIVSGDDCGFGPGCVTIPVYGEPILPAPYDPSIGPGPGSYPTPGFPGFPSYYPPTFQPPAPAPTPPRSRPPPPPLSSTPEAPPPDWEKYSRPDTITAAGEASRADQAAWRDAVAAIARGAGWLADFVNLITYSPDAGLPEGVEDQLVRQNLGNAAFAELYGSIPSDPDTDPYAEPIPAWYQPFTTGPDTNPAGLPSANPAGLPGQPGDFPGPLQTITSSATPYGAPSLAPAPRIASPDVYPFGSPGVSPFVAPGTRANPGPGVAPRPGQSTAPGNATRPRVYSPTGYAPGLTPQVPRADFETDPFAGLNPKEGVRANSKDCGKGKKDDKKKKKPRKPRTICHRGTYVERANGLLKFKKEIVSCQ